MPAEISNISLLSVPDSLQVENAELDWTDESNPRSTKFDDVYYSTSGAVAESEHVFLDGADLLKRWTNSEPNTAQYSIAELGFGSGLNFLNTWRLWQQTLSKPATLHYIAFEKYPLSRANIERLLNNWPALSTQATELLKVYPDHSRICHRLWLAPDVLLDLHFGDALARLKSINTGTGINSWFLDGFSPRLNPELWRDSLFTEIARLSSPGSSLATYSAAGFIRRALKNVGFLVEKKTGYGKKRHMTTAVFADRRFAAKASMTTSLKPWFDLPKFDRAPRTATVIGAGLAGCAAAYALAQRGVMVTVVDAGPSVANGASGIRQLALRPRLFKTGSAIAEFYLQSYLFAASQFNLLNDLPEVFWHPCGVLQKSAALNKRNQLASAGLEILYGLEIVKSLTQSEASDYAGTSITSDALQFPLAGWVNPTILCQRYLESKNIRLVNNCHIKRIEGITSDHSKWLAHPENSRVEPIQSEVIVLANSYAASQLDITEALPLQTVRGQASYLSTSKESRKLQTVVTGSRSIFPAVDANHTVSASYRREMDFTRSELDDTENLAAMTADLPQLSALSAVSAGVGIRCNSPDFLPMVGLIPDANAMKAEYGDLRRDAHKSFSNSGHYHSGLFLSLAHGSNGLATAPMAGEVLASLICGEVSPISSDALASLNAARFLIRDLKQQRS